jgi:hypothetical protein
MLTEHFIYFPPLLAVRVINLENDDNSPGTEGRGKRPRADRVWTTLIEKGFNEYRRESESPKKTRRRAVSHRSPSRTMSLYSTLAMILS